MRKVNPSDIKQSLSEEIAGILAYMDRVSTALTGSKKEKSDVSRLSESLFMDAFVVIESFIFDLFLAYMNHDFLPFQTDLNGRISSSINERFGPWANARTKFTPVKHVPVEKIAEILDPQSMNLTFPSTVKMIESARKWISSTYNAGITNLSPENQCLLDTARSIRNYIAHGSDRAYDEMNANLLAIGSHRAYKDLGRGQKKVSDIGSFLKAQIQPASRRIHTYLWKLERVCMQM